MSRLLSISQANTHTHTGCVSQGPLGPCHRTCWALRKPAVSSHVHRTLYVSVCVSLEVRGDDVQGREGRKDRERENANESRFSWKLHESVVEKVEEANANISGLKALMAINDMKKIWRRICARVSAVLCIYKLKGIVHPKMKILTLITHPHVVPNP